MANVLVLTKPQPAQTSKPSRAAVWVPSSKLPLVIWDNIQSASTEQSKTPMVYHMFPHTKRKHAVHFRLSTFSEEIQFRARMEKNNSPQSTEVEIGPSLPRFCSILVQNYPLII